MNTEDMKVLVVEIEHYHLNPLGTMTIEEYFGYKSDMKNLKVGDRILPNWCRTEEGKEQTRPELMSGELQPHFVEVVEITENVVKVRPNHSGTIDDEKQNQATI